MFTHVVRPAAIECLLCFVLAGALANSNQAEEPGLTGVWKDRSPERRAQLAREYGGAVASEAAVSAALDWIVRHQSDDGGWSFEYRQAACDQSCQHVGTMKNARNAATGLALSRVRDRIVAAHQKEGHARGSWAIDSDPFGPQAGRLYVTALNTLALEVYYRYPPRLRVE